MYAVPDSQTWYSEISDEAEGYAGECCDTIANCPNAYDAGTTDNVKAGWKASTVTFTSVDMAVHSCPYKSWKCNDFEFKKEADGTFLNYNYLSSNFGFRDDKDISSQDQCNIHIA